MQKANIDVYKRQICDKQSDLEEELKGPSKKISVDADGNFTKPALGFMKSKGLDEANVYFKQVGKDEYLFVTLKQEGQATSEVLKEIVPVSYTHLDVYKRQDQS